MRKESDDTRRCKKICFSKIFKFPFKVNASRPIRKFFVLKYHFLRKQGLKWALFATTHSKGSAKNLSRI